MKVAFFSDTHWELHKHFHKIDFTGVELIVFLWDNETTDFELFRDIKIKKIWFLGNHSPWENTRVKLDIFKEFGIEDISWKVFEFWSLKFFGIPGNMKYVVTEAIMKWQITFPVFRDTTKDIEEYKEKIKLLNTKKVDIILSHFPIFGVMDKPKDLSHRGLYALEEYVSQKNPKYLFHGHLHKDNSKKIGITHVQQIYMWKIFNF